MVHTPYKYEAHGPLLSQPHLTLAEYDEKKKTDGVYQAASRYGVESEKDLQVIRDLLSEISMRDAEITRLKKAVSS